MAAPKGNQYARNKGIWKDAIRRALAKNRDALDACAAQLVAAAMNGDLPALKELGDRLDGKASQPVEGKIEHDHTHEHTHVGLSETSRFIAEVAGIDTTRAPEESLPH